MAARLEIFCVFSDDAVLSAPTPPHTQQSR
jgi:hypothetical protein